MKLDDKTWIEFKLSDLFDMERGTRLTENNRIAGKIPLATAGHDNQGVSSYIGNPEQKIFSPALTIDMFGEAFYRNYNFCCDDNIHVLKPKNEVSDKYALLFLAMVINSGMHNFSYGKQYRSKTFKKHIVVLPALGNSPDWKFMSEFMKEKEQNILAKYKTYLATIERERERVETTCGRKWVEFSIDEIFNIKAGKRLTKASMISGKTPFIGASDSNNGVTAFIFNDNTSRDRNVLGVNYNGSVVETFYHPYECLFSDDVKRFSLKGCDGNKYIYLFLKSVIIKQKEKYQYGYKFNEARMLRQKITLPVTKNGEPDYKYMEQTAKQAEIKLLTRYIAYLDSRVTTPHR